MFNKDIVSQAAELLVNDKMTEINKVLSSNLFSSDAVDKAVNVLHQDLMSKVVNSINSLDTNGSGVTDVKDVVAKKEAPKKETAKKAPAKKAQSKAKEVEAVLVSEKAKPNLVDEKPVEDDLFAGFDNILEDEEESTTQVQSTVDLDFSDEDFSTNAFDDVNLEDDGFDFPLD